MSRGTRREGGDAETWLGPPTFFRVFLVPQVAGRPGGADAAVEFVHYNADAPEEVEQLKKLTALIK